MKNYTVDSIATKGYYCKGTGGINYLDLNFIIKHEKKKGLENSKLFIKQKKEDKNQHSKYKTGKKFEDNVFKTRYWDKPQKSNFNDKKNIEFALSDNRMEIIKYIKSTSHYSTRNHIIKSINFVKKKKSFKLNFVILAGSETIKDRKCESGFFKMTFVGLDKFIQKQTIGISSNFMLDLIKKIIKEKAEIGFIFTVWPSAERYFNLVNYYYETKEALKRSGLVLSKKNLSLSQRLVLLFFGIQLEKPK